MPFFIIVETQVGCMDSENPKFALYDGTNESARTNKLLCPLSEVSIEVVFFTVPKSAVTFELVMGFRCFLRFRNFVIFLTKLIFNTRQKH